MNRPAMWTRLTRTAVAAATVLLVIGIAMGAPRSAPTGKPMPSYVIPNIVAGGMCLAVLAAACKRFRRS